MSVFQKHVLLGTGSVGKSAITLKFHMDKFVEHYEPTIEDVIRKQVYVGTQNYNLEILDTAGCESFVAMRDLYIKNGQGFFLVYSMTSRSTFEELKEIHEQIMRVKEVEDPKDRARVPIVLVANKCDLPNPVISSEEGMALAQEWGCPYLETSAKTGQNIQEMFYKLVEITAAIVEQEEATINKGKGKGKKASATKSKTHTTSSRSRKAKSGKGCTIM
eukprot:TRINITY_DN2738_c0_g1_i2.p1 TRINITY_DN2738_c0_g1~~TRINITY_DN2738_c0_g1_i2.p1  ORF type:complete len:218 (-),score=56.62 TRINITY_DN2738_c0_g1_i2:1-654(-)